MFADLHWQIVSGPQQLPYGHFDCSMSLISYDPIWSKYIIYSYITNCHPLTLCLCRNNDIAWASWQLELQITWLFNSLSRLTIKKTTEPSLRVLCEVPPLLWLTFRLDHDDVIKWKHFPRYWPSVRGIHWSPVNSPHKGQWRGALMFSWICARINDWVNNREAGDLRRHQAHCDVIVMICLNGSLAIAVGVRYRGSGFKHTLHLIKHCAHQ